MLNYLAGYNGMMKQSRWEATEFMDLCWVEISKRNRVKLGKSLTSNQKTQFN
jgi:hypothetical protein